MDKLDKHQLVFEAEQTAIEKYGKEVFFMFSKQQRLTIIRDLLPTVPMYGIQQIDNILSTRNLAPSFCK